MKRKRWTARTFYTTRSDIAELFKGREQWLKEYFYRQMRHRHGVLLDGSGGPEGGQWNFDHANRKTWPGKPATPPDTRPEHDHRLLWETIVAANVNSFGNPQASAVRWPLNRAEALAALDIFIATSLPHFGDYEDAMSTRSPHLFHSLMSFALNTKMLGPREVVQRTEAADRRGAVPLAAAEGFIRQVLGWREYVRGIYWAHMPGYDARNALQHHTPLPDCFWTGETRMRCVQHAVKQSLEGAYAHHIQRLMVIGNFALLAGVDPAALHLWYLGVYIDAFEWVELPNTLGMSQFADGGLLATKPYVSSAAYMDRMSDYCKGCYYDKKQKTGQRACPFNALYWNFFARHKDTLDQNFRLAMVYRQLEKMQGDSLDALLEHTEAVLKRLETL